jgi:transposase InsO family protein/transposase
MSRMPESKGRRPRRRFDEEFKAQAVRLVLHDGQSVGAVARDLDLTESALRHWVERTRADQTAGRPDDRRARRARAAPERESRVADGARHPKKSRGLLREAPGVKFAWIAAERAEFTVAECCRALRVSPSGFYAWQQQPESRHAAWDRHLRVLIRASHEDSRRAYGSPRGLEDLIEQGVAISRKRVARLMWHDGLVDRVRKRFRSTTMSEHDQPIAANVLDRQFVAERPSQRWVGDTTEFAISASAKVYLAAIFDLHSRFVVGWALSAVNDRHLALSALDKALKRRCPDAGLLHHSDQGCTYATEDYRTRLARHDITCSMSRRGNCYDNAVAERFFSTVKSEEADRFESYPTRRKPCSITSRCSITSVGVTRRSVRSVPRSSSGGRLTPHSQSLYAIGSTPLRRRTQVDGLCPECSHDHLSSSDRVDVPIEAIQKLNPNPWPTESQRLLNELLNGGIDKQRLGCTFDPFLKGREPVAELDEER